MDAPLDYLPREVLSYLPTGWNLADETEPGRWVEQQAAWSGEVIDGAEQTWQIQVRGSEAEQHGRLEALRLAFDRVYRKALGRASFLG